MFNVFFFGTLLYSPCDCWECPQCHTCVLCDVFLNCCHELIVKQNVAVYLYSYYYDYHHHHHYYFTLKVLINLN